MYDLQIIQGLICPYCGKNSRYTDSAVIYGRSYGPIYWCKDCDAYVGVHKGEPTKALGRLANRDLRRWKKEAHAWFDPIWQERHMRRQKAYTWLSQQLNIERHLMHIGYLDVPECKKVVEVCKQYLETHKKAKSPC